MHNPKELFWYEDGKLYRKHSTGGRRAGSLAGRQGTRGYWQVKIDGKMYLVHHLVWWIFHGYKPEYIDHIDGDPTNNRINNLREATHTQNMWNAKLSERNISGHKGVFWNKKLQKWTAKLGTEVLGHFYRLIDAAGCVVYTRAFGRGDFNRDA